MKRALLGALFVMLTSALADAEFIQQGTKLVGTGVIGPGGLQGTSVGVSGDGNTVIVGGPTDNHRLGAAWVFARSGGAWSQQGGKLVGAGAVGSPQEGQWVAISADGNTAILGGPWDNSGAGAVWIFTRSGGVWSQQGDKLVGTGSAGDAHQGEGVAISADGNTAIVGGYGDDSNTGAAWIFTRSGGVWSQQGSKLVGTGAVASASQGYSVAISGDGNTALVGGYQDDPRGGGLAVGATWVFVRSGGVWSQQGGKLVGTGADGPAFQGQSVAISADGNTAIVGGPWDGWQASPPGAPGATWVFVRSGGVWSQQGAKLVGTGAVGPAVYQGTSVAVSGDGNTALVGGYFDNAQAGAIWVFARSGGAWSQQGSKLVGTGAVSPSNQGTSVAISADGGTAIEGAYTDNAGVGAAWVFTSGPAAVWIPVAAHNPGLKGSQWRSDLGLLNTGSATAHVQIEFFGGGVVSNSTYVPAGTQSILADVVAQIGASGQGALKVVSDLPLKVTSRTYNQLSSAAGCYPNGTQGQDYPGVNATDGLAAGQAAYLAGLTENASYRCNIGLVNLGSDAATVLVELYSGAGLKLTDYTVSLLVGQWAQETQPFRNKAGQAAMDRGYAKITVQSGSGILGFASVVDNVTNDPTTVTMQR